MSDLAAPPHPVCVSVCVSARVFVHVCMCVCVCFQFLMGHHSSSLHISLLKYADSLHLGRNGVDGSGGGLADDEICLQASLKLQVALCPLPAEVS